MDLTFEEVFRIPLYFLKFSRTHPALQNDFKWFLILLLTHSLYMLYLALFMSNLIFYNLKDDDFLESCKNGTVCVLFISAFFQYSILTWKKKFINVLFENIKNDYIKAKTQTTGEQEIVLKYAKQSIRVGQMWFFVGVGGTLVFPFKNILIHIYNYCISEFRWKYVYDLEYPKIINDRKDQMVTFCILNVLLVLISGYGSCIFCASCPLGPNFMLHACGQLEILTNRVEKLFSENHSLQNVLKELTCIAIELQRIYKFVDDIQEAFRIAYEFILKVASVVMPLTVYAIVEAFGGGEISVEFIVYIIGSVIISACPCYYSERLLEKGEDFRLAVYSCGWERNWDRRTRTMILVLLQRASRPIAIRIVFKTLCLDTLTDVYRQSYTIFNLIHAVWN